MPQLVKGGKYVFGWSAVNKNVRILIPEEAIGEYHIQLGEGMILMPGSNTSGGFSILRKSLLEKSRLSDVLIKNRELAEFLTEEGEVVNISGRNMCWTTISGNGQLKLLPHTLKAYGVAMGDYLLAVCGSYLGIGMVVKGPLVEEARNHSEIKVFRL